MTKIGQKNYLIKVYDPATYTQSGAVVETMIADARIKHYKDRINSGLGEFVFDVERTLNDWTTLGNLELAKIIELELNDTDTNGSYVRVYSGYISRINFLQSATKKTVTVTCLGFVSRIGSDIYKNGTTTSITETTEEPATIFKNIIDRLRSSADGNIPFLNYTPSSLQDTNQSVSLKFESDTYLEALNRVLDLSPANWFWKLDQDNIFNFSQKPEVADHNFSMGHIETLQIDYSMETVINGVLTWDRYEKKIGVATATSANHLIDTETKQFAESDIGRTVKNTTDGTTAIITAFTDSSDITLDSNIFVVGEGYKILSRYRFLKQQNSIDNFGRRIQRETMSSALGIDAMDKQAQSILGEKAKPRSSIIIVLADNNEFEKFGDLAGYDIESVKPGQTCRITGIDELSGSFLSKNMLIRKVTYYPTSAVLEVDIDREGIDDLLVNFKRETDQIEKDGIPNSYTVV